MRITLDIPDMLFRQLKTRAARDGLSVREVILRGVRFELRGSETKRRRRVKLPIVPSKKPGAVILDNASIYENIPFP